MLTRGHNTNNFVEASIRVFKDIVLERCKAFNAAALVDFVCTVLEQYHQKRLIKYASSRVTKPELQYRRFCQMAKDIKVQQVDGTLYHVTSSADDDIVYKVYSDMEQCDCPAGQGGAFCKHLCAVHLQSGIDLKNLPSLSFEDKIHLAKLAMGTVDESFFLALNTSINVTEVATPDDFQMSIGFGLSHGVAESEDQLCEDQNEIASSTELSISDSNWGERLTNNLHRIRLMAEHNPSSFMSKMMISFNKTLESIDSPQGFFDICNSLRARRKARLIRVQPTAISRRKKRAGLTSGSRRIQAGRPTNVESGKSSARKRQRCLSLNINANKPNAKPHGSGH